MWKPNEILRGVLTSLFSHFWFVSYFEKEIYNQLTESPRIIPEKSQQNKLDPPQAVTV